MALQYALVSLATVISKALPVLVDASLKGAMLLVAAGLLTLAMRRASAAQRHLVWLLVLGSTVALPIFSVLLPAWRILPRWPGWSGTAMVESPKIELALAPQPIADRSLMQPEVLSEVYRQEATSPGATSTNIGAPVVPATPPAWWARLDWEQGLVAVWVLGMAALVFRYGLGVVFVRRIGREARPVNDEGWLTLLGDTARSLIIRRSVVLLESPRCAIPMTWGILRPVVLLPAETRSWPVERRHAVLAHELAHVKRRDCLAQMITQVARVVYWFNPLVWLAWRRLLAESEQACDDLVLAQGSKASDYAEHLLTVASGSEADTLLSSAAIAMARSSRLQGRLLAILDERRNRQRLTRIALAAALLIVVGVVVPLSALRAVEENQGGASQTVSPADAVRSPRTSGLLAETTGGQTQDQPSGTANGEVALTKHGEHPVPADAEETSPPSQPRTTTPNKPPPALLTASGKVVDPNGKPVAGAHVMLYLVNYKAIPRSQERLQSIETDQEGRFRFMPVVSIRSSREWRDYEVIVTASGKATASVFEISRPGHRPDNLEISMPDAGSLRGKITGPDGRPIAGAQVSAASPLHPPVDGIRATRSNANGDFEIADLEREDLSRPIPVPGKPGAFTRTFPFLQVQHPAFAWTAVSYNEVPSTLDVTLRPAAVIEGRVINGETGGPVAGVVVEARGTPLFPSPSPYAITDSQGRYRLESLNANQYVIWAEKEGWTVHGIEGFNIDVGQTKTAPDLRLIRGQLIVGQVIDVDTGRPIRPLEDDRLRSEFDRPQVCLEICPWRQTFLGRHQFTAVREDGSFQVRVAPGMNWVHLWMPQSWDVLGSPPGTLQRETHRVNVVDGKDANVQFRVRRKALQQ